jgi:hypothetical protein
MNLFQGIQWLRKHFKQVTINVGFTLDEIQFLLLHTTGEVATQAGIERWIQAMGVPWQRGWKGPTRTPMICTTHRHVTIFLPVEGPNLSTRVPFCHPFADGPLYAAKLRDMLVEKQLILEHEAGKLEFADMYDRTQQDASFEEIPEDIEELRIKQKLKHVFVLAHNIERL